MITVGIPTRDRYDSLLLCLTSLALQTKLPDEVIIVDDSDDAKDIREFPLYKYVLQLFNDKGIEWKVLYGQKRGQHISHQTIQDEAKGELIFRIDDDCIAECNVLAILSDCMIGADKIGACAPLVLMPNSERLPISLKNNKIDDLNKPNTQWFKWQGRDFNSDHLYSCFLYRKGIVKYPTELSRVSHREETIFSHSIYKAGYGLEVNAQAIVHHFRQDSGGIRKNTDPSMWHHDEEIFQGYLKKWNLEKSSKLIVLDCGLGDHFAFKHIVEDCKKKYGKLTIAACFPDVFFDIENLDLISIAEAKLMGSIDDYNIYRKMIEWDFKDNLVAAFKKLYL